MALILVVDDHEWVRQPVQAILEGEGHDVVAKSDGPSALEYVEGTLGSSQEPDLVIADHSMPGMYGYEWVGWARKSGFKNPVILLSGKEATDEFRTKYSEVRVTRILLKPPTQESLIAAVQAELEGSI